MESQRLDALITDEKAEALVAQMSNDLARSGKSQWWTVVRGSDLEEGGRQ
jgi:hypothetical protein